MSLFENDGTFFFELEKRSIGSTGHVINILYEFRCFLRLNVYMARNT